MNVRAGGLGMLARKRGAAMVEGAGTDTPGCRG